jgi:hypothetical protein
MTRQLHPRQLLSLVLCLLLLHSSTFGQKPPFRYQYLAGGPGTTNDVRGKRPIDIALQILDANGDPVRNAEVTFVFPNIGATLTPLGGGTVVTAKTDDNGRVRIAGLIPIGSGAVAIAIRVRVNGITDSTTIQHTNVVRPVMTPAKWAAVIAGAAAAAGLGVYLGTREESPTTITLGSGSVRPNR